MSYDIKLTGYDSTGRQETIDLLVSSDEDLVVSSVLPRTVDYTYDGSVRGYDALDPEDGFAHDQDSWHRGAGLDIQKRRGEDDNRYATADGVITFSRGSFSSGYFSEDIDIPNGVDLATSVQTNAEVLNVWGSDPTLYSNRLYCSFYKYLLKYENGSLDLVWEVPSNVLINSLAVYNKKLIIGFEPYTSGGGKAFYAILDENEDVTVKSGSGGQDYDDTDPAIEKMAVIRNADNSYSLACVGPNGYHQTNDPESVVWSAKLPVGNDIATFTSMTPANNTVYVGSNEGLFAYDSETNSWIDIEPSLGLFEHVNRYGKVIHRNGALYVARFDHNLWRVDDSLDVTHFTELRNLVKFPAWIGMSGNVAAMAQDSNALYCMLSESPPETGRFPYAFPYRFGEVRQSLFTLVAIVDNDTSSHVLSRHFFRSVDKMKRYAADTSIPSELLIFGTSLTPDPLQVGNFQDPVTPKLTRLLIPPDEDVPYRSNARVTIGDNASDQRRVPCNPNGYLNTQWFDFHWPDSEKVLVSCAVDAHWGGVQDDTSIRPQVVIYYRTESQVGPEGDDSWIRLGSSPNVGFTTIEADTGTPIIFKRIRFKIELATDIRVPILVDSFVVHAMFGRPHRKRHQFLINFTKAARDFRTTAGESNPIEKREKLGRMVYKYPILELDFNPDGHLHWLRDREDSDPRYVRVRRFEDDLQSKGRFDTRTSIEMVETRGNL